MLPLQFDPWSRNYIPHTATKDPACQNEDRAYFNQFHIIQCFQLGFYFFSLKCHGECLVPTFLRACLIISLGQILKRQNYSDKFHIFERFLMPTAKMPLQKVCSVAAFEWENTDGYVPWKLVFSYQHPQTAAHSRDLEKTQHNVLTRSSYLSCYCC